jgi:hypothetical protein
MLPVSHAPAVDLYLTVPAYGQRLGGTCERLTWAEDKAHRKRIEQAARRFLRAIKALAAVRRLQLPAMQVNIGEKQVNVAR